METTRMELFSDAVIAILITVMVLELKVPHGTTLHALRPLLPVGLTYVLSFALLGIWWNNHHHMLQLTDRVNGNILLANLHLLFWLSLFPVATGWMGQNGFADLPTAAYGIVLLFASIAYYIVQTLIIRSQGTSSRMRDAVGKDLKGKISPVLFAAGIGLSFVAHWVALAVYVFVALMWFVPDRRLERYLHTIDPAPHAQSLDTNR